MWTPKYEDLLKRRSETRSASRVSEEHTTALKVSTEHLLKEAKELEEAARNIAQSVPEKPSWKATSTIINDPWPTMTLLAAPDPRGRGPVTRPQSAKKVETCFGRKAVKKKDRPKSAPRDRPPPLNPNLAESVDRLAAPKRPSISVKAKDDNIKKSTPKPTSKEHEAPNLPSVVFKTQVRLPRQVRKRSSIVTSMGGISGGAGSIKEESEMPGWFAPGSGEVDTQTIYDTVNELARFLNGHVHMKDYENVTQCKPVKEWVNATKSKVDTEQELYLLEGMEDGQSDDRAKEEVQFLESDRPPFPSFDHWRYGRNVNSVSSTTQTELDDSYYHGSSSRADMKCYSRCKRLYARSSQLITFEEVTAVRCARDACHFFLSGGPCKKLCQTDISFLFGKPAFHTHWVRKVLYCPVSKLVGGVLVDMESSRGCFRVTGFSKNIPPSVSLDELSDAGPIPSSLHSVLICLEPSASSANCDDATAGSSLEMNSRVTENEVNTSAQEDGKNEETARDNEVDIGVETDDNTAASSLSSEDNMKNTALPQSRRHSMPEQTNATEALENKFSLQFQGNTKGGGFTKTLLRATQSMREETKTRPFQEEPTPIARHISTRRFPDTLQEYSDETPSSQSAASCRSSENMATTAEAFTVSLYDHSNYADDIEVTNKSFDGQAHGEKEWFKGSGSWTFDPSKPCERFGLVSPIAIIKCAKRHTAILKELRKARQAKAREWFKEGVLSSLRRSEEARLREEREAAFRRAQEEAEEEATYEAESVTRLNQQSMREPWCRALWEALWCGQLETIKQCFDGMMDNGIITDTKAKLFHCEVVFPSKRYSGAPLRIAHLEPCGAPSSVKHSLVEGDGQYSLFFHSKIRRVQIHSCLSALDVYLCMHELSKATNNLLAEPPKAEEGVIQWLQEHCGHGELSREERQGATPQSEEEAKEVDFIQIIHEAFSVISVQDDHTTSSVSSTFELGSDDLLSTSKLLPSIGKFVQLEVPSLTGEKIEMPTTARDDSSTLHTGNNSPTTLSQTRRRSSVLSYRILSEENEPPLPEEEEEEDSRPQKVRNGTSLWWKLREEALKDKARATDIHFTKREPFKYKRMNSGKLM